MQARRLPARHGLFWLVAGARLYRSSTATLTSLTLAYLLVLLVSASLPLIGAPLASLLRPFLVVMVANGCRVIARRSGPPPTPAELTAGLVAQRPQLLRLGGLYLVASLLALMAWLLLGGGAGKEDMAASMAKLSLLALAVEMPFWFAPLLTAWGQVPATKSLFFSLVSVVRNWRAFLVYAMAVALVSSIVGGFLVGLSSALPVPALATVLAVLAGLFLSFVLTPILMASIYLSYRDVFADDV